VEQPKPAGALFYGFSRQCSRRLVSALAGALRYGAVRVSRTHCLRTLAARPYRPGRYFILALNQVPD